MKTHIFLVVLLASMAVFASANVDHNIEIAPALSHSYRRSDHPDVHPTHTKPTHTKPTHAAAAAELPTTPSSALPVCGNGIIEHGEECDCGSPEECAKDPCCNIKTCKLALGAQCSNQQDCCDKCHFRPATFVCRAAASGCDTLEMCTGKSGKCPANKKDCGKHHSPSTNSTASDTNRKCGTAPCTGKDLQCQAQSSVEFNFTTACTKEVSTCQISCTDPRTALTGSSSCLQLSEYFTDGTECGQEGICTNGACVDDKGTVSFFKKNMMAFAIGGASIIATLFLCLLSICCLRRRRRMQREKEKNQANSYPMSENLSYNGSRRSNIRIGLDPIENGMVDVLPSFDSKGSLTRRTSTGLQHAQARTGRVGGPYAPDSLMTEQDMVLDLESDSNQRMSPSISTWSQAPIFHSTAYRPPTSTDNTWGELKSSSVQKSNSNHTIYVPPPLPPVTLTSSTRITGGPSPYADEAMKIRPPTSPPPPLPQAAGPSFASSSVVTQKPITQVREAEPKRVAQVAKDDDEPSVLNLDNTLTVDRYTKTTSIAAKDRASVSSFFSTLAIEPEPIPPLPSYMPMLPEPSFASGEFIIPAPVARIAPANPAWAATPNKSSSQNQKSAYEKKQEEADCFAQDLGFEIVNPSPAVSPRGNVATPAGQSRM